MELHVAAMQTATVVTGPLVDHIFPSPFKIVHKYDFFHKALQTSEIIEDTVLDTNLKLATTVCWLPPEYSKHDC